MKQQKTKKQQTLILFDQINHSNHFRFVQIYF